MPLIVNLPPDLERALQERAAGTGLNLGDFILESLRLHLAQLAETEAPDGGPRNGAEAEPEPVWRGVFAVEPARREVFSQEFDISAGVLRRWQPEIILNPRWFEDVDD